MIQQLIRRLVPGNGNLQWCRLRKLTKKQQEFDRLQTHIKGFVGGRGVGKTEVGAHYILKHCRPGDPVLVVSPDYNVIQDTTWPTFQRVAEQTGQWIHGVKSPTPRAWFRPLRGGDPCLVVFRSAEKPDKLRGGSWALIWYDEASIMCHEAFTYSIPALRWRGQEGTILITMTPKGVNNWTFSLFFQEIDEGEREILDDEENAIDLLDDASRYRQINGRWYRQRENTGIVQAHSRENPFLPATYEHDIGMHLSKALQQQELAGEFIELAGLYFQRHWFEIVDAVPRVAQRVRYWDRASTHAGGCFSAGVLMARTDNGLFYVEDVRRGQWSYEERNAEIVRTAREDGIEYGNTVQIWGEQEGGSAGKEVSQQFVKLLAGYPVHVDIVTGKGTRVLDGIEVPHKPKLIRAQGVIAQSEAGNVKLKRAPWNAEFLDELCLARGTKILTMKGWVEVENVQAGDWAWTRLGWNRIATCRKTGINRQIGEIVTSSGLMLQCTSTHPVYVVGKGFVSAIHVGAADELLCSTGVHGFTSTQTISNTIRNGISPDGETARHRTSTGSSTNAKLATYLRDRASIMSITTRWTTDQKTWSAKLPQNIITTIGSLETFQDQNRERQYANGASSHTKRPSSEDPKPVPSHVLSSSRGQKAGPLHGTNIHVNDVENHSETSSTNPVFVGSRVLGKPTAKIECFQRNRVRSAESYLSHWYRPESAVAESVHTSWRPTGVTDVWNLEVQGQHEYFANGILVHNCAFGQSDLMDQVDALSGACNKLCRMWTTDPGTTTRIETVADGERFGVHLDKIGNQGGRR